jgi:hypothetical protein
MDRTKEEVAALLLTLTFSLTVEDQQAGQVKVIKDPLNNTVGIFNRQTSSTLRISRSTMR